MLRSELSLLPELRVWLLAGERLDLTLTVTGRCNFRCTYCYEDFSEGTMLPEVVAAVMALVDRRAAKLKDLSFQFFGGEPLLAKNLVVGLSAHALGRSRDFGFKYHAGITTNGWFLDASTALELCAVGVDSFQISLDGPPEVHNRTRRHASEGMKGTFDRIWANLNALSSTDLDFQAHLRCHVSADNFHEWYSFAPSLNSLCEDSRFRVHVEPLGDLGGPAGGSVNAPHADQLAAVRSWFGRSVEDLGAQPCYAAIPTSWVVLPDGGLSRCTVIGDSRNQIGHLMSDGTMSLDNSRLSPWFEGWSGDDELLQCPLKKMAGPSTEVVFLGRPPSHATG